MKTIFFDTGPIISLTTNNLLWLLPKLKEHSRGEFYITSSVREELVERPLRTKKFKFEALQVKRMIEKGALKIYPPRNLSQKTDLLLNLANRVFSINGNNLNIVHRAEMEVLAAAIEAGASAIVIDERTTRYIIEDPFRLEDILKHKFHAKIDVDRQALKKLLDITKGMRFIRSVELVTIAFEKGFLNEYLADIPEPKKTLLESVLWGVKLHGCSVSHLEIDKIVKLETRR